MAEAATCAHNCRNINSQISQIKLGLPMGAVYDWAPICSTSSLMWEFLSKEVRSTSSPVQHEEGYNSGADSFILGLFPIIWLSLQDVSPVKKLSVLQLWPHWLTALCNVSLWEQPSNIASPLSRTPWIQIQQLIHSWWAHLTGLNSYRPADNFLLAWQQKIDSWGRKFTRWI